MEEDINKAEDYGMVPRVLLIRKNFECFLLFLIKIAFVVLPVMVDTTLPDASSADEFRLVPSITVREEYNDNIFASIENTSEDFITTITPCLELVERTERLDINLSAKISPFYFSSHASLNDIDQTYRGSVNYQINQRLITKAHARYDVSNRPDRDIETTGLVESNDKRNQQEYGVGLGYTLTEKSEMAISLGYFKERWDSRNLNRQDLETYGAMVDFSHNLSYWVDPTIGHLKIGFERYKFETSDTYNFFTTVGSQYWFSETTNLFIELGARYTDANFYVPKLVFVPPSYIQVAIGEINKKSFGGIGSAAFEIRNERMVGSIKVAYEIGPASGRGTTVQRSGAVIKLRRRFVENSVIAISTGYFLNKGTDQEFSLREINEDTFFVNPSIRWEFYKDFTLEAGYNFNYNKERVEDEEKARNLVYLQIAYRLPLLE